MSEAIESVKVSQVTVKEFAMKHQVESGVANSVLQFLVKTGHAKLNGSIKAAGGKGKPANIFEVKSHVELEF
jgi:hypothetical protein